MVRLSSQADFRPLLKIPFCYLCGKPNIYGTDRLSKDHVPPRRLFQESDRTPPLQLRTHEACNVAQSSDDEAVGQLVGLLHARTPQPISVLGKWETSVIQIKNAPKPTGIVYGHDLKPIIWRWIRGFHAALYQEYLPVDNLRAITSPIAAAERATGKIDPIKPDHFRICLLIATNLFLDNYDSILAFNGKCKYVCVWSKQDDSTGLCLFALQLYNWKDLGCPFWGQRACVGAYPFTLPKRSTTEANQFLISHLADPTDPFSHPTLL